MSAERIVVFCISPLGDTIFATPAIRALREHYPKARMVILASSSASQVLKYNPFHLEIITVSNQWELFKRLAQIRKENFELALSFSQLGCFFTRFCATPLWSDFTVISGQKNCSVVQMCNNVLRNIGLVCNSVETDFWSSERDQQIVDLFLKGSKFNCNKPLIAIHCGGHYFVRKRWSTIDFTHVIRFLMLEAGYQIVLVGGAEDVENSFVIRSVVPDIITAVGMLKLTETAALLRRCCLFIGNDSGPLHLAAALKIPTIGLFGPTDPQQFYPYSPPRHTFIYKSLSCSPCYKFGGGVWQYWPRCSKAYCMEAITLPEVIHHLTLNLSKINNPMLGWAYAGKTKN